MAKCFGAGDELYEQYHDQEWGVFPHVSADERELLERLVLEGFQAGLSWLTILRKRTRFRQVFSDFDPSAMAAMGPADIDRLLADAGIVRNRAKITAAVTNAGALLQLHAQGGSLHGVLLDHQPADAHSPQRRRHSMADWPATTPESGALSRHLKQLGFAFVGPTTAYATMQALGIVDDHISSCPVALARDRHR